MDDEKKTRGRGKDKAGAEMWRWIRNRWENSGATDMELQKVIESTFGVTVPISSIKTKRRRQLWVRNPSPDVMLPVSSGDQALPDKGVIFDKPSFGLIRADEKLAAIQAEHDRRRALVASAGEQVIDAAIDALRKLPKDGSNSKDLKSLGDALHRGAEMLFATEDRERKARGLDRPENQPQPNQAVTQILINVQSPRGLPESEIFEVET